MSGNGNGKVDQRIAEATRRQLKAKEPLDQCDAQISVLQQRLAQAQTELVAAQKEWDAASTAYADDDGKANRARLLAAADEAEKVIPAKIRKLTQLIAEKQAERAPLEVAWHEANTALSKATTEVKIEALRQEIQTHSYHAAQHETAMRERQRLRDNAKEELFQIEKANREANWLATQRLNAVRNHPEPGTLRVRH